MRITWKIVIAIIIGVVLLLLIWSNCHRFYQSKNKSRHRDEKSVNGGHFSKIDAKNYLIFPRLLLTHPQEFIVRKGEALFIPKKWWHWVRNPVPTAAVNFWFIYGEEVQPYVFQYDVSVEWNSIDNSYITTWKSDGSNTFSKKKLGAFRRSHGRDECVLTAGDYRHAAANISLKKKLKDVIPPPEVLKDRHYDLNVWISNGQHDTGLHFDDYDGILTVIYGEKHITLYPPEDTPNLYPYKVSIHNWVNNPAANYHYNTGRRHSLIEGVSSGRLLHETCKDNRHVTKLITSLLSKNDTESLTWGYKKYGDNFRWELYRYNLEGKPAITSIDVYPEHPYRGDESHQYHNLTNTVALPFWGYGTYVKDNETYPESKIFVIDTYSSFKDQYDSFMNRMEYADIKDKFRNIILNKYSNCYQLCVFNKKEGQIFVMYMGLTNSEFIKFLKVHGYKAGLISFLEMNIPDYHINNEIAIIYDTVTTEPIRSGFYGVIHK